MKAICMNTNGVNKYGGRTARYNSFHDNKKNLIGAIADMEAHDHITATMFSEYINENTPIIAVDGNISLECLNRISQLTKLKSIPIFYEPTSSAKCAQVLKMNDPSAIKFISPNSYELQLLDETISNMHNLEKTSDLSILNNDEFKSLVFSKNGCSIAND
jgi:hypothetical protein